VVGGGHGIPPRTADPGLAGLTVRDAPPSARDRADLLGGAFIGLAALLFGAVVILGKVVTDDGVPVPAFLALRFGLAAAMMAALLAVLRRPLRPAPGERLRLAILGAGGYGVESALFFLAIRHGGPAAVTLLFFTYPVWVALLSMLSGRGLPGRLVLAALVAAVAGAALVVVGSGGLDITTAGIAFALASALTYSVYLTGADRILRRTESLTGAMWVSASAATGLTAAAAATGNVTFPHRASLWLAVVAVAAFTAGAFVCLFAGLRRLGAIRTAIISAAEPLVAAFLSVLVFHERLYAGTIVGGLMILAGAVAASVARGGGPAQFP